jgi:hypothetical protein
MAARWLKASDAYMHVLISGMRPAQLQAMRELLSSLHVDAEVAQDEVEAARLACAEASTSF